MKDDSYDWAVLEASAQQPIHITSNALLVEYCARWQTLPMIALDTEFQRIDTFYPIPGLIQIADDQYCYLIDPLSIDDLSPLSQVFSNPDVLKIIHAGSEDLELFNHTLGVLPSPIFDTQLAAAFIGWGFTMGLQRLLEHALDIQIGKGETTSDWLKRPLSPEQEVYAALDVAYLPAICLMQKTELESRDRLSWFVEESEVALQTALDTDPDGREYYRRFSQMSAVSGFKLAALRDITMWREQQCRLRDTPRNWVLRNQTILSIINNWPRNSVELARTDEMRHKVVREEGEAILAILENAYSRGDNEEIIPINRPLPVFWNKRLKKLKAIARDVAGRLGIAQEILLRKKDLEALIRSGLDGQEYQLPDELNGWRREIIGLPLLAQLKQFDKNG
ncbi:ribonuclease D [Neptunomonas qingdaonensis]|uniref:Ribonuclease D n=1 Tax=Neptunomonas qingdaonensis TaxID=1045558 RepID=A0A1I2SME2_9GAMM|nr:ribonuclease D [Neptunomonas qingdaonensis]SFG53904.1 ribonuclease D [Neptunomonas qingdaonensis]